MDVFDMMVYFSITPVKKNKQTKQKQKQKTWGTTA